MFRSEFDTRQLIGRMTVIEKRALPGAVISALNDSAFEIRQAWADEVDKVFDRPLQITRKAALVKKATREDLRAEIFVRNEASRGTPPSRYLLPQVQGGDREQKPSEYLLARRSKFHRRHFVPGLGISNQLDAGGNVPGAIIKKIISQLGAARDSGVTSNESERTRTRRLKRQRKKGGGGSYFVLTKRHGKLKPGVVYERFTAAGGSAVRSVLVGVSESPRYTKRYPVIEIAQRLFGSQWASTFRRKLQGMAQ